MRQGNKAVAPPVIHATAVYSTVQLQELLDLGESTLRAEKRAGRIRWARRAGRDWYKGQWVLDWIEAGAVDLPPAREG